ncbi:hypothetical protein LPA44_03645 [Halobacterium sp. KA-4]|jgi:hypothetical protein|uniref:hypothetical protein n=1 Tax=Halobacterium sp. KA-4 TaxID=2896367 RepID=UPI001E4A5598|nr:hypothetical protein [Halobacterium sp. KA-4]MCD2198992.1 hypothetical protein [Halobacterium sp. KA-4]
MRSFPWVTGTVVAIVGTALAQTTVALELAALPGLVWGVVAWMYAGYPAVRSLTYRGLDGRDRWLVAASLGLTAAAFAPIELVAEGATATVLYAELLGVCVGLLYVGALIEARSD